MKFDNPYLEVGDKLDLLARWLIVHSIIYYELDTSIVSDAKWDSNAKQYLEMSKGCSEEELTNTRWYYIMHDFDGSTGFYFYKRLNKKDKRLLKKNIEMLMGQVKGGYSN